MQLKNTSAWFAALTSSVVVAVVGSLDRCSHVFADTPPNVVVFLADDLGWADWQYDATLNPTGSVVYETPNLVQLAQRSMTFTNAYATSPVCSPTRASVLTGKSPARTRISNYLTSSPTTSTASLREPFSWQQQLPGPIALPNVANVLKNNGYYTGHFGKWHLGSLTPTFYGFNTAIGVNLATDWFAGSDGAFAGLVGLDTPGQYPPDEYLTDALSAKAGDFVQQNANHPFLLMNWDYGVHIPLGAPSDLITKYTNKINALMSQHVDLKGQTNATYAAMVEKLDQSVGALMARLDDPNLDGDKSDSVLNNTIFIFTSDNGGTYAAEGNPTNNYPLREGKGSLYEGGIRVPLMVSYPNDPFILSGITTNARTSLYDLYPTIFDLTGISNIPLDNPIDGRTIRPALEGDPNFDRGLLFWHYPHRSPQDLTSSLINGGAFVSAVANNDWKLLFYYDDRHYELYNTTTDIGETTNLLGDQPDIAHDLSLALVDYLTSVNAQMPVSKATGLPVALPPVLAGATTSTGMAGDYNGDHVIDIADYDVWRSSFGSIVDLAADGNLNGTVDIADYVLWRKSQSGIVVGTSISSSSNVPEPSPVALVVVATLVDSATLTSRTFRRPRVKTKV